MEACDYAKERAAEITALVEPRRRIVSLIKHGATDWWRKAIWLGVQMAETEARRMLALKTQQVIRNLRRPSPPPVRK
jgi:hypothetical protein